MTPLRFPLTHTACYPVPRPSRGVFPGATTPMKYQFRNNEFTGEIAVMSPMKNFPGGYVLVIGGVS